MVINVVANIRDCHGEGTGWCVYYPYLNPVGRDSLQVNEGR